MLALAERNITVDFNLYLEEANKREKAVKRCRSELGVHQTNDVNNLEALRQRRQELRQLEAQSNLFSPAWKHKDIKALQDIIKKREQLACLHQEEINESDFHLTKARQQENDFLKNFETRLKELELDQLQQHHPDQLEQDLDR